MKLLRKLLLKSAGPFAKSFILSFDENNMIFSRGGILALASIRDFLWHSLHFRPLMY